jgi:hypothetical protein
MDLRLVVAAAAAATLAAPAALAQDRPSEETLFGAPAQPAPPPADRPATEATPARPSEGELFGSQGSPNATPPPPQGIISREKEDALRLGGQVYLRATTFAANSKIGEWSLSSPNLLDLYADARPNDRVRAFVLGRLVYDPTILPPEGTPARLDQRSLLRFSSVANPRGVLDQLWVNFDVEHRAFVTVGRQHAKWGVGRFWNPTDYLHPVRRDPLAVFDERTGATLVKVHVPWEAKGWNLYAVTMLEDVAGDPPRRADGTQDGTNRLGRLGAGGRAEVVLAGVELGADAMVQGGHRPRFGVDFSTGLWDLDVYGEAALRTSVDTPRWRLVPGTEGSGTLQIERHDRLGLTPQVVAGATYGVRYSDEDSVFFGAEYFYDRSGYDDPRIYPALVGVLALSRVGVPGFSSQPNPYTPFYLGRQYAAAHVSLPSPGRWNDTTLSLSVIGSLSDRSFIARLDHAVLLLTYLKLETFVAARGGARDGEFRLGFDGNVAVPGTAISVPVHNDPMIFDAGIAIRVAL